jgi:phage terminase large subunit-like protein
VTAAAADPVTAYATAIAKARRAPIGTLHRLACARHLADLRAGPGRGLVWSPAHARDAIGFFSTLRHWKAEWSGRRLALEPWQQFGIGSMFGWRRADGLRRFRVAYWELPRKNGKSTIAAGVGLLLAFFDGEPGAEGYCAATKQKQARIVFDTARRYVGASPALLRRVGVGRHALYHEASGSSLEPIASDSTKLDGLNAHVAIVDELHAHRTSEVVDVLESSMGARRQPFQFEITTAGIGQENICWKHHKYSADVLEGLYADDAWFAYIFAADEGDDWTDPRTWQKANPNYGVSVKPDYLVDKCRKAQNMPSAQNVFKQKHLDVWTEQAERWIDMALWDACARLGAPRDLTGLGVYGGLDLSSTRDMTALALGAADAADVVDVVVTFWIPAAALEHRERVARLSYRPWVEAGLIRVTPGNVLDYDRVRDDVLAEVDRCRVLEIGFDPWNAQQLAAQLMGAGVRMVPIRPGYANHHEPTASLGELVAGQRLRHGANPVLRWQAANAVVSRNADGQIKLDRKRATDKIDGVVATVMMLDRLTRNEAESAYETGDLEVVSTTPPIGAPAPEAEWEE